MSATPSRHHHQEVRDHYRGLASDYSSRANRTCEQTYLRLVRKFLSGTNRVLEVGSGSSSVANQLGSPFAVACDLSLDMLRARTAPPQLRSVVAAGEDLPFQDAQFDGLFLINVLEHVDSVDGTLAEAARVLKPDGIFLTITPNGNWEFWLDLAERWNLKLPEGPHAFLTTRTLRGLVHTYFDVLEHRTFLVLPAGPPVLAALVDKVTLCGQLQNGFFQVIAGRRRQSRQRRIA